MSEWLTIGEVVDGLKVEQKAECVYSPEGLFIKGMVVKNTGYDIHEDGDSDSRLRFSALWLKTKWRILPKYVSAQEALTAYVEGKTIISHMDGIEGFLPRARLALDDGGNALVMDKARIKLGKWTIEKEDKPNE